MIQVQTDQNPSNPPTSDPLTEFNQDQLVWLDSPANRNQRLKKIQEAIKFEKLIQEKICASLEKDREGIEDQISDVTFNIASLEESSDQLDELIVDERNLVPDTD